MATQVNTQPPFEEPIAVEKPDSAKVGILNRQEDRPGEKIDAFDDQIAQYKRSNHLDEKVS